MCVVCRMSVCMCALVCLGRGVLWRGASPLCMTKVRLRVDGWALSVIGGKGEGVLEQVIAKFWTNILRYFFSEYV